MLLQCVCRCLSVLFLKSKAMGHRGLPPSYTNISLYLPSISLLLPPIYPCLSSHLDNAALSFSLGGGLPWTNIVPYAGSSGGPYCVWRNGELTPMSEPYQWGHCVWIFLQLTQSHPTSLPCTGQARGYSGCPPPLIIWWKHAHNSELKFPNKPSHKWPLQPATFCVLLIFQQTTLSWICLCCSFWQKWGPQQLGFLIEKNKATHKGLYCISMITGFRMLSEYFKMYGSEGIHANYLFRIKTVMMLIVLFMPVMRLGQK